MHNTHNYITVQAQVHMENSPVQYEHRLTSNNISSVEKQQDSRSRPRENNNQQLPEASIIDVLSIEDIVPYQECNMLNQDAIMDQELLQSNIPNNYCNPSDQLIINHSIGEQMDIDLDSYLPYSNYHKFERARRKFKINFSDNSFGHSCSVCDRLWYKNDLKKPSDEHKDILTIIIPNVPTENTQLCNTCFQALNKNKIPSMSTYNGFKFPKMPEDLVTSDLISERLISPRISFMQIRRLRHVNGQYGIYGQIINVPVSVNNMVKSLPRSVDDDYCINVHIKRKKIHRSSYLHGIINKRTIKTWLRFLISTPLYTMYDIKIDDSFFTDNQIDDQIQQAGISEHIPIEESLTAQQQTLM